MWKPRPPTAMPWDTCSRIHVRPNTSSFAGKFHRSSLTTFSSPFSFLKTSPRQIIILKTQGYIEEEGSMLRKETSVRLLNINIFLEGTPSCLFFSFSFAVSVIKTGTSSTRKKLIKNIKRWKIFFHRFVSISRMKKRCNKNLMTHAITTYRMMMLT